MLYPGMNIYSAVQKFMTDFFTNQRHRAFFDFKISTIGIYTGFCVVVQFLKSCRKFLFLDFL